MLEMANLRIAMFESKIYKGCIQPQPRGSSPTRKSMVYGFVCCGRLSDSGYELWWRVPQLFNVLLNTWKQLNGEDLTCFRFSRLRLATRQSPTPLSPPFSLFPIGCRRLKLLHNTCSWFPSKTNILR